MLDPAVQKIQSNPKYLELRRKRNAFGWLLAALMMVVYYGYIALIAFNKVDAILDDYAAGRAKDVK